MNIELKFDNQTNNNIQENYDAIQDGINKLFKSSEEQFENIKKEKWFTRIFDMLTFSQKNKKRLAEQITNLSQAQEIFVEMLLRLSQNDVHISKMIVESLENICSIQNQNEYLLSKIIKLEKNVLGLNTQYDFSVLENRDKIILNTILRDVCNKLKKITEEQKDYVNALYSYLGINTDEIIKCAQDLLADSSEDVRKIIFCCCSEYLYLGKKDKMEILNDKEYIDIFDLGTKTTSNMLDRIEECYHLRGTNGFIEKYKVEVEIIDENICIDIDSMFTDVDDEPNEVQDDYIFNAIMHIAKGAKQEFYNKNLHFETYISCEGELFFENCIINFNEKNIANGITLQESAKIYFKNSVINCCGYDNRIFIKAENKNHIIFENCTFVNCSNFIKTKECIEFSIQNCVFNDPSCNLLNIDMMDKGVFNISNNEFCLNDISDFNFSGLSYLNKMICVYTRGNRNDNLFINNIVNAKDSYINKLEKKDCDFRYIDGNIIVENCIFNNVSYVLDVWKISACEFIKCKKIIYKSYDCISVADCLFEECSNIVFNVSKSIKLRYCQFISCFNELFNFTNYRGGNCIEYCEFLNTRFEKSNSKQNSIIQFKFHKGKQWKNNIIQFCIFDGLEIDDGFLIETVGSEKSKNAVCNIENCDFRNCKTGRQSGKIIKEYLVFDSIFKKNISFLANKIDKYTCSGLDKINEMGICAENIIKKKETASGKKIGPIVSGIIKGASILAFPVAPIIAGAAYAISDISIENHNNKIDLQKIDE